MTKRTAIILVSVLILVPLLAVGMYLFQPWKIFTNTTVNEALPPTVSVSAQPDSDTAVLPSNSTEELPQDGTSSPVPSNVASDGTFSRGTFISQAHETTGTARIIALADGTYILRLEDLDTDNGPDLKVWLTDAPILPGEEGSNSITSSTYLDLGVLKGNKGNQNYPLPAGTDPADYTGIVIWCDRFSVSFGGAELSPVSA